MRSDRLQDFGVVMCPLLFDNRRLTVFHVIVSIFHHVFKEALGWTRKMKILEVRAKKGDRRNTTKDNCWCFAPSEEGYL